ncbi:hypothetical protein N9U15_01980 [Prochlorococcus sp. AH-736-P13]|nr:hypothetical protein [Prochlorococcus sp. AH-736-P13]MDA9693750.1 hypothetical protein [Prochlorococcus sp. AH-736-P13]
MNYSISSKKYINFNFRIIVILVVFHLIARLYISIFNPEFLTIPNIFLLDVERNIPTLYSGISLMFSALILYFIGHIEKQTKIKFNYYLMALLFLFLSCDEIFMIHEISGRYLRNLLNPSSFLYFAWVIPYGIMTILVSLYFYNFIKMMPKKIFHLIIISGILFVGGELVLEMVGGFIFTNNNKEVNFIYLTVSLLEEVLSMCGIALFNYSILNLLSTKNLNIKFIN